MIDEDDVSLEKEKNGLLLKENVVKAIFEGIKKKADAISSNNEVDVVELVESDEDEVVEVNNTTTDQEVNFVTMCPTALVMLCNIMIIS